MQVGINLVISGILTIKIDLKLNTVVIQKHTNAHIKGKIVETITVLMLGMGNNTITINRSRMEVLINKITEVMEIPHTVVEDNTKIVKDMEIHKLITQRVSIQAVVKGIEIEEATVEILIVEVVVDIDFPENLIKDFAFCDFSFFAK